MKKKRASYNSRSSAERSANRDQILRLLLNMGPDPVLNRTVYDRCEAMGIDRRSSRGDLKALIVQGLVEPTEPIEVHKSYRVRLTEAGRRAILNQSPQEIAATIRTIAGSTEPKPEPEKRRTSYEVQQEENLRSRTERLAEAIEGAIWTILDFSDPAVPESIERDLCEAGEAILRVREQIEAWKIAPADPEPAGLRSALEARRAAMRSGSSGDDQDPEPGRPDPDPEPEPERAAPDPELGRIAPIDPEGATHKACARCGKMKEVRTGFYVRTGTDIRPREICIDCFQQKNQEPTKRYRERRKKAGQTTSPRTALLPFGRSNRRLG